MKANEEVRRLLDERGWKYRIDDDEDGCEFTEWSCNGITWEADGRGELLYISPAHLVTPKEAVETTLGRGTCHLIPYNENYARCSECGISLPRAHGGWWFYCPGCGRHLRGEKVVDE